MEKQWVKIPELLFFQEGPGVRNSQYTSAGVKLFNVANLVDGKIDLSTSDRYISEVEAYGKYKHFLCDAGDLIVASSGIKVEYIDKKMGFVDESMLPLCMNTSTIRFKVLNKEQLAIRYFMYYLKSQHFKEQLAQQITGSAQLNYGPSHLKKMVMPLIEKAEQDSIVQKLDKTQEIISACQQELQKLDDLVKARFVEMFLDKEYPEKTVRDVMNAGFWLMPATPKYVENGSIPYITSKNIKNRQIDFDNVKYITEEAYESISANRPTSVGDILVSMIGTLGQTAVISDDKKFYGQNLYLLRLNNQIVNIDYFCEFFNSDEVQHILQGKCNQSTQAYLKANHVEDLVLPVPPMELQEQYADFVKQVDKSKTVVQAALYKAQTLFDSLMQQYFG